MAFLCPVPAVHLFILTDETGGGSITEEDVSDVSSETYQVGDVSTLAYERRRCSPCVKGKEI